MIKVASIDTGISRYIQDECIKLRKCIYYDYLDEKVVMVDASDDYNGHGTLSYNTFKDIYSDIEVFSIDILGISGHTNKKVFCAALEYVEKLDVDVISICASCIVDLYKDELKAICKRISDSGKVIVASVENGKKSTSIADFDSVIGVIGKTMIGLHYSYSQDDAIQMCCDSSSYILMGKNNLISQFSGNSRATAIATGIICKLLSEVNGDSEQLGTLLDKYKSASREAEDSIVKANDDAFNAEEENQLLNSDDNYIRFIYLLCDFFSCNNPDELRTTNLVEYRSRILLRDIHELVALINERFGVKITNLYVDDIQWAYKFYIKYVKCKEWN